MFVAFVVAVLISLVFGVRNQRHRCVAQAAAFFFPHVSIWRRICILATDVNCSSAARFSARLRGVSENSPSMKTIRRTPRLRRISSRLSSRVYLVVSLSIQTYAKQRTNETKYVNGDVLKILM